jgi:GGDEF domain-containing protein/uncharacterized protein YbaR (Trm112 family)
MRDNSLVCPYCKVRLRHLGSDYDHPLESIVCESCSQIFTDSEVVAVCHNCGAKNAVDDLNVVSYFAYQISEKGRISARVGEMESMFALFDRLGNVSHSYFEQFLDWNIDMLRRYKNEAYLTVTAIKFGNIEEIADIVGASRMAQLIDTLTVRLKEILRTTDVVTRSSMGTLCFLLPHTNAEEARVVTARISDLRDLVTLENAPKLEIDIVTRTLPESGDIVARERNAKELLANIMYGA